MTLDSRTVPSDPGPAVNDRSAVLGEGGHPSKEQLTRFFDGMLGRKDAARVKAHARECETCSDWLGKMEAEKAVFREALEAVAEASPVEPTEAELRRAYDVCAARGEKRSLVEWVRSVAPSAERHWRAAVATAAAAALAVGVGIGCIIWKQPRPADRVSAATFVAPHLALPSPRAYSLAIGVEQVRGEELWSYANRDAERIARVRGYQPGLPGARVRLLDQKPTASEIRDGVRWLVQSAGPDGIAFLYIAGFADDSAGDLQFRAYDHGLPMKEILETIAQARARRKIVIVDVCFAGRSLDELTAMSASGVGVIPEGMVVLASCASHEKSWNDGVSRSGYFTRFLCEGLDGPADRDGDGKVTAEELNQYVADQLRVAPLPEPQTPRVYGDRDAVVAQVRLKMGSLILAGEDLTLERLSVDGKPISEWRPDGQVIKRGNEIVCSLPAREEPYRVRVENPLGQPWEASVALPPRDPVQRLWVAMPRPEGIEVAFTSISASQEEIRGEVRGLDREKENDYGVAVYVHTDRYYRHPLFGCQLAKIEGGKWRVQHIIRGSERRVAAVLLPRGATPVNIADRLDVLNPAASAVIPYEPEYRAEKPSLPPGDAIP